MLQPWRRPWRARCTNWPGKFWCTNSSFMECFRRAIDASRVSALDWSTEFHHKKRIMAQDKFIEAIGGAAIRGPIVKITTLASRLQPANEEGKVNAVMVHDGDMILPV